MKEQKTTAPLSRCMLTNEQIGLMPADALGRKTDRLSLLLHSCCGPCSSSVIERLAGEFNITVLYYNPCITDEEEYKKRRAAQVQFIEKFNAERIDLPDINFMEGPYEPGAFLDLTKGHEEDPEGGQRCSICFRQRLEKAHLSHRQRYRRQVQNRFSGQGFQEAGRIQTLHRAVQKVRTLPSELLRLHIQRAVAYTVKQELI